MNELNVYQAEDALQKAGEKLNELFSLNHGKQILFLTSGGSAFQLLDFISSEHLGPKVTITVLDERFSSDPNINNFSQLRQTHFYQLAQRSGCSFIPTESAESIEKLAEDLEKELKKWKLNNPEGVVICTQGIGEDGHTAGIMPFSEDPKLFDKLFNQSDTWVAGYDATEKNPYPLRVTTTLVFLKNIIDHSIFFVSEEKKTEKLKELLAQQGEIYEFPALVVWKMKDVILFTDLIVP